MAILGLCLESTISCVKAEADTKNLKVDRGGKRIAATPTVPIGYGTAAFDTYVNDSFQVVGGGNKTDFYNYMERGVKKFTSRGWGAWIKDQQKKLDSSPNRQATELEISKELHGLIKKIIPKFSLDRGYEFNYTVAKGERQCYLQSMIVGGLLQRCGMNCGLAMVWKNDKGQTSNNGHAVPVVKLSGGHDVIVDCSDPEPFMHHQGLFVRLPDRKDFAFVEPQYDGDVIKGYADMKTGKVLDTSATDALPSHFLKSQFDYYRGERSVGGILLKPKTADGMMRSLKFLRKSVHECPENPLSVLVLANTLMTLGDKSSATEQYAHAKDLYARYGWAPPSLPNALKKVGL